MDGTGSKESLLGAFIPYAYASHQCQNVSLKVTLRLFRTGHAERAACCEAQLSSSHRSVSRGVPRREVQKRLLYSVFVGKEIHFGPKLLDLCIKCGRILQVLHCSTVACLSVAGFWVQRCVKSK